MTPQTRPTSVTVPSVYALLGPTADDLLNLDGVASLTKSERWHLIDLIDNRIDTFQRWQLNTRSGTAEYVVITAKLRALRLKRYQVWSSFYPNLQTAIRLAA